MRTASPLATPARRYNKKEEEGKTQEAKVISGIRGNFWRSLAPAADGISQMASKPGAALGVTPIPGFFSAIMNYASRATSGKRTGEGIVGPLFVNSPPQSHHRAYFSAALLPRRLRLLPPPPTWAQLHYFRCYYGGFVYPCFAMFWIWGRYFH